MIKNVVFDFGQVLVRYQPLEICAAFLENRDEIEAATAVLFSRELWGGLDAGTLTNEEAAARAAALLPPHLATLPQRLYSGWIDHLPPIPETEALVRELSALGVPLYLLSNISAYFAENSEKFPILSYFRAAVFSGACRMVKPHADIFLHLFRTAGIRPEETLFIDDTPANIAAAEALGMRGYLFDGDAARLRNTLASYFPALQKNGDIK